MRRDVIGLAGRHYDLIIVGGGVYGVCAAWEAALRGVRVALVERGDFGEATTGNSLQTIHGGLRYLQHLDLPRMRESIRERRAWMRLAPGLITAMPFVLPTHGHALKGPEIMRVALAINDLVGTDRNRGLTQGTGLPRGRVLSRRKAVDVLKQLKIAGFNGAAVWYDGFNDSPERLLVAIMHSASEAGAQLANYVEAVNLLQQDGQVCGIAARDSLTGREFELRSRCVLNAAGPWADSIRAHLKRPRRSASLPLFRPSKGMNLIVRRLPFDVAVGIPIPRKGTDRDALLSKGSVTYFIMPWGKYSLIGTKHLHFNGAADQLRVERGEIIALLEELSPVLGDLRLNESDVVAVKCGLLPEHEASNADTDVVLQKHASIVDHEALDGVGGLVSVIGVKWTTARAVATRAVDLVCRKLHHRQAAPAVELRTLVVAGAADGADQVARAAREEMAVTLADALLRRTSLALEAKLELSEIESYASVMRKELGWSDEETTKQVRAVQMALKNMNSWRAAVEWPPARQESLAWR